MTSEVLKMGYVLLALQYTAQPKQPCMKYVALIFPSILPPSFPPSLSLPPSSLCFPALPFHKEFIEHRPWTKHCPHQISVVAFLVAGKEKEKQHLWFSYKDNLLKDSL